MTQRIVLFLFIYSIISSCSRSSDIVIGTIDLGESKVLLTQEADSLNVPWDLQYDRTNKCIIFSEIAGNIRKLNLETKEVVLLKKIPDVFQQRSTGLLGMALYQPKRGAHYLFLSYTTKQNDKIYSNLYRYIYTEKSELKNPKLLLRIAGNTGHNGSRIIIGHDQKLYWATGDAASDHFAQDSASLNGKILRINTDGSIPADNPISNSYVYAWGFRNIQGLTQGWSDIIYTSEHGDAIEDELNLIRPLCNYGWPLIEGRYPPKNDIDSLKQLTFTPPVRSWTPVIAPSGMAYYRGNRIPEWRNSLILTTLKSQSLRILKLSEDGRKITDEYILFKDLLGRLRSVITAPNGDIYFCSSNRDWNPQKGFPKPNDDRIYRLSKTGEAAGKLIRPIKAVEADGHLLSGKQLYASYCSSCHKADGKGIPGTFPSLENSKTVNGEKRALADILLNGLKEKTINGVKYDASMPSFDFLKDEEAAAILNYIRTGFNNQGSTFSINELKQYRKINGNNK
ncbi:PQQ-dependent sugar dehydrogenase [Arcticibacter tournemirensis]|uniref:C-type cytochrome n=1 Tax=Arcticibacter tournemirensis TaxID=699437 RepID=A0A4Q0MCN9_9SPHI|nr:PQQ-dependent sugar dehydrogenase [Arcticibacter tournemirensis]RXF70566.1 c-type cytochrome [Arcticibacter tournemirensis]